MAHGLSWQAALKKTEVKLELLTDIYMLLMVEKNRNIYVEYVMQFIGMQKLIINTSNITMKIANLLI